MFDFPALPFAVGPRPRRDQAGVDRRVVDRHRMVARLVRGDRGFQERGVVAVRELGLKVRAAALVPLQRPTQHRLGVDDHVAQRPRERQILVRVHARVAQADVLVPLLPVLQLVERFLQSVVVADDRAVVGHPLAQFLPDDVRIFRAL